MKRNVFFRKLSKIFFADRQLRKSCQSVFFFAQKNKSFADFVHIYNILFTTDVVPATSEAMLLHLMDLLDSQMNMFSRILDQMEPGTKDDSKKCYFGNIMYKSSKENL